MNKIKNLKGTSAVIGVDWGDSGKGRLIDDLAQSAHIIARYNGGSNTGHTVKNQFGKFALHITPSGIFNKNAVCIIGRGVSLDLESLIEDEFNQLKKAKVSWKNLKIDEQATLTMPYHKLRDGQREEVRKSKIGTTRRGVGPSYADRVERNGLRVKDLYENFPKKLEDEINYQNEIFNLKISYKDVLKKYQNYAKLIKPFVTQTIPLIKNAQKSGKNILFEGAQGYFLDIDAGTYPFVTSSNTGVIGIAKSFDILPDQIANVIGITKAYTTRVGQGPMPTIIKDQKIREHIIEKGAEVGTTSGRIRDPGYLDLVLLKTACQNNRVTHLAITKLDVLTGLSQIKVCTGYKLNGKNVDYISGDADFLSKVEPIYQNLKGWDKNISKVRQFKDLPKNAKDYISVIEKYTGVKVNFIGVGPQREEVIYA